LAGDAGQVAFGGGHPRAGTLNPSGEHRSHDGSALGFGDDALSGRTCSHGRGRIPPQTPHSLDRRLMAPLGQHLGGAQFARRH
jgi:hypothetical protein